LSQLKKEHYKVLDFHLRKIVSQAFLEVVEIHLSEHCNLSCFGCNHFSQLAEKKFPDILKFEQDMKQLFDITKGFVKTFRLMGGEPLLNPECKEFMEITRRYFSKSAIWLVTNGILLNKQKEDFWFSCQRNNVEIRPTKYPINIKWNEIENLCQKYQIPLIFFNNAEIEKTSWKFSLDPLGKCDNYTSFTNCSMANHCIQFKDGKLFTCPISAHIEHFNKFYRENGVKVVFEISEFDYIDIYQVKNYQEILSFLAKPIPFCRYCKVLEWKEVGIWRKSSKNINEYLMNG
ncbi:4Fe-4S cluster-binding domain-containing protein, partial [Campylobacter jejuni]|nr:4Fe-4S cluster-binding domain-containing protein [Campylobacter jejuni]